MSKKVRYFLVFIILALGVAFAVWKITFKKSEARVASKKADVEIEAVRLLQDYEMDESAANAKYLDKIVVVTGTIASVNEDSLGISLYLKENDAITGVICSFDKSTLSVSSVQAGSAISIKGICTGYLMDVVLNKCALVPPAK